MKRSAAIGLLLCSMICSTAAGAHARAASMVFWYPGEAGSTEEAQPVLDDFLAYVGKKMGDVAITGRYYNTVDGGLKYIAQGKPAIGIVSFAALSQYGGEMGDPPVMLSTLPLPEGKPSERYALVGTKRELPPGARILSSEPLTLSYVRERLFPKLSADASVSSTTQLFSSLKKIASGEIDAFALLTPIEAKTLENLGSPWAKRLITVWRSESVPTAKVLLFDRSWKDAERLKEVLIGAGADPEAKELLQELRLKGFSALR
ncbi:MAG: hypothetical protein JXA24_05025 [Proteobacteria bacterium]|nr:hypothetical protein [Pseudomonadota bacterium]